LIRGEEHREPGDVERCRDAHRDTRAHAGTRARRARLVAREDLDEAEEAEQQAADDRKDHDGSRQRAHPAFSERQNRVSEQAPSVVRRIEPERKADEDADDRAARKAPTDSRGADPNGEQDRGDPDRGKQEQAVEKAPSDRTEDPLPEEQRQADAKEQPGREPDSDRDPNEDRDALDLVGDLADLGLGKLDVSADQPLRGITGGADLLAQAGCLYIRRRPGSRRRVRRVGGRVRRTGGVGSGRRGQRLVQGGLPICARSGGTGR
jgi:hypothetical protein